MSEMKCPSCGRELSVSQGAAFCPFCGGTLTKAAQTPEDEAVKKWIADANAQADPVKKHDLLLKAQAQYPNSLAIAQEILFLGRLYQRNPKNLDFSVIKCYMLMIYLEPDTLTPEKTDALRAELFNHPDLDRCLALAEDPVAFTNQYLVRLCGEFIELFLYGSGKYMHRFFGFGLDSRAPKLLASPVAHMLSAIRKDALLSATQRGQLLHALYNAYSTRMAGDMQWLEKEMAEIGVTMD
ncbi:MAG TPA: zinc ribbon domain-containing protein [Candidatus Limiplasma sp.]|nr:zinc ribbon domain-containing protein [Candidatus Limiplasma sp.]HPS81963.1 zinc ribbon domain-containing protein [Candidatus Limiplasma sp.]